MYKLIYHGDYSEVLAEGGGNNHFTPITSIFLCHPSLTYLHRHTLH